MSEALTPDDIGGFVRERWGHPHCMRCGHTDWVSGDADNFKAAIPIGSDPVSSIHQTNQILPAIWMVCTHCGNVEFISIKIIRAWKAGR